VRFFGVPRRTWRLVLLGLLAGTAWHHAMAHGLRALGDIESWEREVAEFERRDRAEPPPPGRVVFVGSSTIASWSTLARDMAPLPTLNRGLGGTHISHVYRFARRIVLPYEPSAVVIYAGDNDLADGGTAESILIDFRRFAFQVHERYPDATIYFLAIKPSPSRWGLWREMRRGNALIAGFAYGTRGVEFVDVATPMLDETGRPREYLYAEDGLHLSSEGYALWTSLLRPLLLRDLPPPQ
jgi:hypothetical protein